MSQAGQLDITKSDVTMLNILSFHHVPFFLFEIGGLLQIFWYVDLRVLYTKFQREENILITN